MEPIFAYIDPGSGSLVIQALIAGMVAIPIFFRHQIRRVIRSLRGQDEPTTEASGQDDTAKRG
jgi:hypothetical protein